MYGLKQDEKIALWERLVLRWEAAANERRTIVIPDALRSSFWAQLWWTVFTLVQDRPLFVFAGTIALPTYLGFLVMRGIGWLVRLHTL